jgi:hypothetical protein
MSISMNFVSQEQLKMILSNLSKTAIGRRMGLEDRMIARAQFIDGYVNPIAYDENHTGEYGYYVCKTCKQLWSMDKDSFPLDTARCLQRRVDKGLNLEVSQDVIYVMGPKDNGVLLNFHKVSDATHVQWEKDRILSIVKPCRSKL